MQWVTLLCCNPSAPLACSKWCLRSAAWNTIDWRWGGEVQMRHLPLTLTRLRQKTRMQRYSKQRVWEKHSTKVGSPVWLIASVCGHVCVCSLWYWLHCRMRTDLSVYSFTDKWGIVERLGCLSACAGVFESRMGRLWVCGCLCSWFTRVLEALLTPTPSHYFCPACDPASIWASLDTW